jgi:long-subunit fatty acid transport protein
LEFKDAASLSNIGPVLHGLLNLSGLTGSKVDIDMTIPQALMLSGYHQLTDSWAIMGNIGWQDWSEFGKQELTLRSTTSTKFTQDLDYDDTWHFALVTQYRGLPTAGFGPWAQPTTLRLLTATTNAPRICLWTGRSALVTEFNTPGIRM